MLEIRAEFRSSEEWRAWLQQHRSSFDEWRAAILDDITKHGIVEPISGAHYPARAITINPVNLRESVSVAEINSRKRAGLFALDLARLGLPPERQRHAKMLGAEAVTRVARVLRGAFAHFLAAEYLPTLEEREQHYPIPHLDLMNADFPAATFDLFYSGDVLEHVPDLPRALAEIRRMLRAGGVMVSTFPFNAGSEATQYRASLDDAGNVIHHLPPEYHDNPARPSEGSLVFSVPGWDVLAKAREAGFSDAKMTLILSSTFGIVSAPVPGIFVMSAATEGNRQTPLAPCTFNYHGPRLRRVFGLVGLARSGTTLLCSILGVHSRIAPVYEPYNANKHRSLPSDIGIDQFLSEFPTQLGDKDILLVKETSTDIRYLDRTAELLRSIAPPLAANLIVLLRNPWHVYLSVLDAQRKWWGGAHEITVRTFQSWADHNLAALARLLQMAREFGALIVSYEALAARKERLVPALMHQLGLEFEERQLSFEKFVDKRQVRGDVTIATAPFAISDERTVQREVEFAEVAGLLQDAGYFAQVRDVSKLIAELAEIGVARFHSPAANPIMRALRDVLTAR